MSRSRPNPAIPIQPSHTPKAGGRYSWKEKGRRKEPAPWACPGGVCGDGDDDDDGAEPMARTAVRLWPCPPPHVHAPLDLGRDEGSAAAAAAAVWREKDRPATPAMGEETAVAAV